jgi:Tfp pilus assembly protein PilF
VTPELATLRQEFARFYFHPEARLRLAKYLAEHGQAQVGFYVSEECRQTLGDDLFDAAHGKVFLDFDPSPDHEAALTARYNTQKSAKLAVQLADIQIAHSRREKAEQYLREAVALEPNNFNWVAALAAVKEKWNQKEEGEAMIARFMATHPDSPEARGERISELSEKNRAAIPPLVDSALASYPEDARFHQMHGAILHEAGKLKESDAEFDRAAELAPDSADIQGEVARYYLKGRKLPLRAVSYYLKAYFLSPHYYDWEYAEARIRSITYEDAEGRYKKLRADGRTVVEMSAMTDPVIQGMAIEEMKAEWKDFYVEPLLPLLYSDDPNIRAAVVDVLSQHPSGKLIEIVARLEKDSDLRVRSMMFYLIPVIDRTHAVARLQRYLADPAELLRYDAASALILRCDAEGKAAVKAAAGSEPNAWWKGALEKLE